MKYIRLHLCTDLTVYLANSNILVNDEKESTCFRLSIRSYLPL